MDNTLENFINYCDRMQIANEGLTLKDDTPKWMADSNTKNNKNRHMYSTGMRSIYNSEVRVDSYNELDNNKETTDLITKILSMVKKSKPDIDKLIKTQLLNDCENWDMPIKSNAELTKLIMSLDNSLDINLYNDTFKVDLCINNKANSANAGKFFGNHCWIVSMTAKDYNSSTFVIKNGGLNG